MWTTFSPLRKNRRAFFRSDDDADSEDDRAEAEDRDAGDP